MRDSNDTAKIEDGKNPLQDFSYVDEQALKTLFNEGI